MSPYTDNSKSWLRKKAEVAIQRGFERAYSHLKVDPGKFLFHLRSAYQLPVADFDGMFSLPVENVDAVADHVIRNSMKLAAVEGAGLGIGGFATVVPDLSILAAITMRMIQKLSLVYGFQYSTDEENAELWIAAASAAGVDISRDLIEKNMVKRFIPRVVQRVAAKASTEAVEKWSARVIPIASSAIGAGLNYYFLRSWGRRAQAHFRARHLAVREGRATLPRTVTVSADTKELSA